MHSPPRPHQAGRTRYAPRSLISPPKAKSVIFLFLQGGLSQVDSFDPKPALARWDGKLLPAEYQDGKLLLAQINAFEAKFMQTRRTFKKRGQSGIEISDLFEKTAELADELAVIRSCYHESFIHGPALSMLNTGSLRLGAPSLGAWTLYGLGSESDSLPAYVVMTDNYLRSSKSLYGTGFLPATYQGTLVSTVGPAFENLSPSPHIGLGRQRRILDQVHRWNRRHLETREDDSRLDARMNNYEPGVPDADGRAGTGRSIEGARARSGTLRTVGKADGSIWRHVPAGAPHGRTRRALRSTVQQRLGRA